MTTVKVEVQISAEQLLKAVEQLSLAELEHFVLQVITFHAYKKAAKMLTAEPDLFINNHQGSVISNYNGNHNFITAKATGKTLRQEEYKELLYLSEQIDKLQAQRIEYLADLARLHGVSLTEITENLGIQ
jgi:hypothetical protein